MRIAFFQYRCRMCGEVFTSGNTMEADRDLLCHATLMRADMALAVHLKSGSHHQDSVGIGELIGYTIEDLTSDEMRKRL